MKLFAPAVCVALLFWLALSAHAHQDDLPSRTCVEGTTVFQDVSGLGRKDRAAKNLTARHAEMAKEGWRLVDLFAYTENGDLEGFFVSYVRDTRCPEIPRD